MQSTQQPLIILGTNSPRRHAIMNALGARFTIAHPHASEVHYRRDAVRTVRENALLKHQWCRARHADEWIVTADTIVEFEGETIGKPADLADASRILQSYSGNAQMVFTAVAMSGPCHGEPEVRIEASSVQFGRIDERIALDYLKQAETLDRAGAYDINTCGESVIVGFSGSYTNIMGLPAEAVRDWLLAQGYPLPPEARLPSAPTTLLERRA